MTIKQLEECSSKINKHCKAVLEILNDPIKLLRDVDKIDTLLTAISLELAIFNNFTDAMNKLNKKEGEE